jgi:trehalose 6-phosphate synthase
MVANNGLVVVSNRLPVSVELDHDGELVVTSAAGGLVTALGPVLRDRGGRWIGWSGHSEAAGLHDELQRVGTELGYTFEPVDLTEEEIAGFYQGLANETLWPLFHDLIGHCNFDPAYWPTYVDVNAKFARAVADASSEDDYVWVQDYHLMLVGRALADLGVRRRLGFFLHIPFPPLDVFEKIPWRQEILDGLLHFELVGFQTERDLRNYLQCLEYRLEDAQIDASDDRATIRVNGRVVRAGAFPISIDYANFLERSVSDPVSELVARVRMKLPSRNLILGLDRLDYTKGIPQRLEAFDTALRRYPELSGRVTLLQIVVPSRSGVGDYAELKDEIDRMVGRVTGDHAAAGWAPIQYIFRRLTQTELLAYYRACDVALITPLKDGMNLVCKEYCACSLEDDGVLILSEFAGAAQELRDGAILVNPFDTSAVADAIHEAVTMSENERHHRMQHLRAHIRKHNVFRWVDRFLAAAAGVDGRVGMGAIH